MSEQSDKSFDLVDLEHRARSSDTEPLTPEVPVDLLPGAKSVSDSVSEEETGPVIEVPSIYPTNEVMELREEVLKLMKENLSLAAMVCALKLDMEGENEPELSLEDRVRRLEKEVGLT